MSQTQTRQIAQEFLSRLGSGAEPEKIAELFSPELDWNIPGDVSALPWIGKKTGHGAVRDFVSGMRELLEPLRFNVYDVLVNDTRAVILGDLASRLKRTGKSVDQDFAIVLTVAGGKVVRFLMLEDSFAVSRAASPG